MKRMLYQLGATAVAVFHLAFIVFVVIGGLLLLRWPRLMWLHVPAAVWGVLIEFCGWYCPLTNLEKYLLQRAGKAGYDGGFLAHYIFSIIYPSGLTRGIEIALGIFVLAVNAGVYWKVLVDAH
jgi:hypothetical protein